jgi:transposase-like protein
MTEPEVQSKKSRRKFDNAFKRQAVELWLHSGRAATQVAAELGIRAQLLSAWPNNWKPKTPACGARTSICASSGIF